MKIEINLIKDLLEYKMPVPSGIAVGKTVTLYCKPLSVEKDSNGVIKGYNIIKVFEVESYLFGDSPNSSIEKFIPVTSTPDVIKDYFSAIEIYGESVFENQ